MLTIIFFFVLCFAKTTTAVVNGQIAAVEEFPWVVAINTKSIFGGEYTNRGTGSIISLKFVITANHILDKGWFRRICDYVYVRAATNHSEEAGILYSSRNIYKHPNYQKYSTVLDWYNEKTHLKFDVALIEIEGVFDFGLTTIQRIQMIKPDYKLRIRLQSKIAGYGLSCKECLSDGRLKVANFTLIDHDTCRQHHNDSYLEKSFCAQDPNEITTSKYISFTFLLSQLSQVAHLG